MFSKEAAGVSLFYTYCMYAESELMRKDKEKIKQN